MYRKLLAACVVVFSIIITENIHASMSIALWHPEDVSIVTSGRFEKPITISDGFGGGNYCMD